MSPAARDQALRLRVFRFVLAFHEDAERWPTEGETARALEVSVGVAAYNLQKLHGADGLPAPTNRPGGGVARGKRQPDAVIPVDVALQQPWTIADMVSA